MPHEWWHRPEIWSDYAAPALGAVVQAPGVKQTLEGIEALHRRGVVPTVSRALEPLPLRWEETPGVPQDAPWYRPDQRFQQGRVVSNFDQYLTPEGDISPGGILRQLGSVSPAGWAQAIAEENLPITPVRPDTLQQQNIMEEARARGIGSFRQDPFADFTPSGREQREIREDLYKLPPYTRGIAEELPYLAIPPARVMRGGLQAARTGPRFSSFNTATGAARPWAAPARGGIRATEMALKPLEVVEEGLARAVAAPFRGAAAGYRALQPTPPTQVPQIPRGPSAQQAILGPSVEPTPAPGASMYDYQRQVGGSAAPDVQPTPVQAVPERIDFEARLEPQETSESLLRFPETESVSGSLQIDSGLRIPRYWSHRPPGTLQPTAEGGVKAYRISGRAGEAEAISGKFKAGSDQEIVWLQSPANPNDPFIIDASKLNLSNVTGEASGFIHAGDIPTSAIVKKTVEPSVAQVVPEPSAAQAVPEPTGQVVSRETLPSKERVQLLSESTNPVVKELLKIHTEGVNNPSFYGTVAGRPIEASNIGLDLSRREYKQLDEAILSLREDNIISDANMRIRDRQAREGFRSAPGYQITRNREGRTPEQLNRFLSALESIEQTPIRVADELPINRVNRPDLPEQYFDDAGELLTEDVVTTNYINPIREIVDVDRPQRGWASVVRKLERQIERTEDADIVEGLEDVRGAIDEFRDMERDGMSFEEWGWAKNGAFEEIVRSTKDLRPSDQFADTLEEAVEINRLLADAPEAIPEVPFRTAGYSEFEAAKNLNKRAENLAPKSEQEFARTRAFISEDGNTGYLIDANGDFGNLFSNAGAPKGAGKRAVVQAIEEGALTLDAYAQYLPEYYSKAGWVEVARNRFVDDFAPADWDYEKLGRPDVVHMAYTGGDRSTIINRYGDFTYTQTSNYMEDFDAAKQLARETAEQAERAGGYGRAVTPEEGGAVEATQRGRVVSGEPGVAAEPGPVGGLPEPELTRFEPTQLTAEPIEIPDRFDLSPQEQLDLERSRTPDIPLQEMSVQSYRERFPDVINSPLEAINNAVHREPFKQALKKAVGLKNISGRGAASVYRKLIGDRFPEFKGADALINFRRDWFSYNIRTQIADDFDARGFNSAPALDISRTSVGPSRAEILHRSINSSDTRAATRIQNLFKSHVEPAIAKGVVLDDIERYAQVMFWRQIKERFKTLKKKERLNPEVWNADTGVYDSVSDADLRDWASREWLQKNKGYTSEQLDALESTAESLRDLYAELRTRLLNEGILTRELHDEWVRVYSWYNPIDYVEFLDKGMDTGRRLGGKFNVVDDGVYSLSENPKIKMGAQSVFGETLFKHIAREEARIARNKATKIAVDVYKDTRQLKDVTDKFETVLKDGTKRLKNVDDFYGKTVTGKPFADSPDSGYFSYYENGERKVFAASDGGPIHKDMWDDVMGRTGMAMDSPSQLNAKLAATNGWFRSVYTTYNPLFWVRNMVIDIFTGGLKSGVSPLHTGRKVIQGLYNVSQNKQEKFAEMMRLMDGWGETSGYVESRIINDVRRELINADQADSAVIVTSSKQLDKLLRRSVLDRIKDATVRVGGVVEAAPRYAAAEKTLHRTIGKKELNRIKNLPEEKHMKTMLDDWIPETRIDETTGREIAIPEADRRSMGPFVDTPQSRAAAENSFMATLDFSYGGAQIKKLNDYFLFLKAATEGAKIPFRALGIDLFPVVRPVQNPTRNGAHYEFGSASEQLKHYATLGIKDRPFQGRTLDIISGGPTGAAMRIGAVITAYLAIQEYWNKSFTYQGTPLYYDIPQYVRYNSLIFMLPPERDNNGELVLDPATDRPKPKYLLIPHRLREWNSIFQAFIFLSEETDEDETVADDKRRWATEVFKSTSPIAELPMPEIFTFATEQISGYDLWRESPIVPEDLQEGPLEEQYTRQTSKSIRAAAGVVDELDVLPDFMQEYIGSPSRLEHLYESILGGVGTTSLTMADFAGELMEEMRDVEARPMEEKVADYREMSRLERAEFRASLSESEYRQFEKEIREPKKEVPFWSALERSFYPQRGGGLREAGRRAALSENPEISEKDTRNAGIAASKVRRELLTEQQSNDSFLDNWRNKDKTKGALSPKEWREAKSDKWKKYEGAQIAISRIYKNAAQSADPNVKDKYYSDIYTAAGTMPDTRVGVDFLLAGYYAIEPTEDSPTDVNWDEFFSERNEYVASIQAKSESAGDGLFELFQRSLEANDTPTEKAYDSARELLAPYWNVGKNLSEITSGASPEIQQLWDEYLAADRGTQRQMQDNIRFIDTLIELRSLKRKSILEQDAARGGVMDEILVFWYGDFHQGVTLRGQQYHDQLYGKTSTGFVPRTTEAIPVRTR